MATRMQQRRGTAAQWLSTNNGNGPVLNIGEIGYESDTNKFKIGDGVSHWIDLNYFADAVELGGSIDDYIPLTQKGAANGVATLNSSGVIPSEQIPSLVGLDTEITSAVNAAVSSLVDSAPGALNTLNELAAALADDPEFSTTITTALLNKQDKVTGISDIEIGYLNNLTGNIQTQINSLASDKVNSSDLSELTVDTVSGAIVAGDGLDKTYDDNAGSITLNIDSTVATKTYADDAVSTHNSDTTDVHGIADTAELATKTFAANLLVNATKTNIQITGDKDGISIVAENGVADSTTDNLSEGTLNKYFTDERAQDAIGTNVGTGLSYNDTTGAISVDETTVQYRVANVSDTEIGYLNGVTSAIQTQLDDKISASSTNTLSGKSIPLAINNLSGSIAEFNTALTDNDFATLSQAESLSNKTLVSPTITVSGLGSFLSSKTTAQLDGNYAKFGNNLNIFPSPAWTDLQTASFLVITGAGNSNGTYAKVSSDGSGFSSWLVSPNASFLYSDLAAATFSLYTSGNSTISSTEIGYLDGVTSAIQTQLDAKASLAGATFTGNVEVDGNLVVDGDFTVNGTNFSASATSITIEDNLVQLAHQNAANTVDLGLVVAYNDGSAKHAGIVRDVSDAKWKLFKDVTTEPATTVNFGQGSLDDLAVAGFEATSISATSATIGDVSNTELQYLNGVTSAIQTQLNAKAPTADPTFTGTVSGVTKAHVGLGNVDNTSDANKPVSTATQTALDLKSNALVTIDPETASYTLVLANREQMVEMNVGSANTLTVPANSSVAFPIGTRVHVVQTGSGQTTITPASGVTINGTPGLKTRAQWSAVTLVKRASDTWIAFGDLTA